VRDSFSQLASAAASVESRLLISAKDAAAALSVSERTLFSLTAPRGPIPVTRLPGVRSVRYSVDALRDWIASQQTN
jgi:predicted DNA-binding transcriptional regulator AlpA